MSFHALKSARAVLVENVVNLVNKVWSYDEDVRHLRRAIAERLFVCIGLVVTMA